MRRRAACLALAALLSACSASRTEPPPAPAATGGFVPSLERRVDAFPVQDESGHAYAFPFLGGMDRPRPQLVDIDGDGDLDLFIQEYTGRMSFFERISAPKEPARYRWRTDRWQDLDVGEWSRFVDLDGDGDIDLLAESPFSYIRWYRNDGGPRRPTFTLAVDTLRDVAGAPIYADRQNIPQLADLDCNRRLDLFLGRVDGTITRYEMRGLDSVAGPRFALVTERFEDIQIIGGDAAPGAPLPNLPTAPGQPPTRHGANTMAVTDLDRDGDQDILWGDFFEPGLLWIRNTGSCVAPSLRGKPIPFPSDDPLHTSGYNAPAVADGDGDGDLDLLVGVLGGAYDPTRTSQDNLYYLEQAAPGSYAVRTRRHLDGLDLGTESVPTLADLDGDGDLDLVVGNKIEPGDPKTAGLYLLRNVGSPRAPAFRAAGRLPVAPAFHYAPSFGDLDGDGDQDLVLGTWRDAIALYRNDGSDTAPRFVRADSQLVRLTRGSHATPSLGDLDGDGDLDLVLGEGSGTLNYYRNVGTRTAPRFELVSDEWLGLRARRSVPRLVDLDGDGDLDLVVGNEAGPPLLLRNAGTRTAPELRPDSTVTLGWPPYSAPAFADVDGDGDVDLLLGNSGGGVMYFENASGKR